MNWLKRYEQGQREAVWDELCALGYDVRSPTVLAEAREVARAAMRIVRSNIEVLVPRWESAGYEFGYDFMGDWAADEIAEAPPLLGSPTAEDVAVLDEFEAKIGCLPVTLRAFYEVVGAINLVGQPPDGWPDLEEFDALQIDQFTGLPEDLGSGMELHICPDHLHKVFVSGAGSLTTPVPDAAFDATLNFEDGPLRLEGEVLQLGRYLRLCLLEGVGAGIAGSGPTVEMRELASALQPF